MKHNFLKKQFIEPTVTPGPCEMQTLDSYTIFFSWNAIPESKVPGRFLGYRITYKERESNLSNVILVDPASLQRTVNTFQAYTWYWVEIAGYSNGGIGPPCMPFVFRTPEGGKKLSIIYFFVDYNFFILS